MKIFRLYSILYLFYCFFISACTTSNFEGTSDIELKESIKKNEPGTNNNNGKADDSDILVETNSTDIEDCNSVFLENTNQSYSSLDTSIFSGYEDTYSTQLKTVIKKIEPTYNRNTVEVDDSGNLIYTDNVGIDDDMRIVVEGKNYRLSNTAGAIVAGKDTKQDGNAVLIPITKVKGEIVINTQGGDDTFTVDLSKGNFDAAIQYDGGEQNTVSGDDMVLIGADATVYDTVTHTFVNNSDGFVDITGNNRIGYVGLEPITDNLNVANRVFTFTNNSYTQSILDTSGSLDNRIDSNQSESVDFNNPTNSLTINATNNAQNRMRIRGLDAGFNADLTVNGEDSNDEVWFEDHPLNLGNRNLNLIVNDVFFLDNVTAGSITSTSGDGVFIEPQSTVLSNGGNISITAGTVFPNLHGGSRELGRIQLFGHIRATGSGHINLNGTTFGPNNLYPLSGIRVGISASIISDTGNITLTGRGIEGGFNADYRGITIDGSSEIRSNGGNITVVGTGRNVAKDFNLGVLMTSGTTIETTGSGIINITATGYNGMEINGIVSTKGSGNVSLQGTSMASNAPAINIVSSAAKLQAGGNMNLTANVGPIKTPNGAAQQALISANNTTINGTLMPGQSIGQLISNTNLTIQSGNTVEIEFKESLRPGTDYDQIVVNGAINITGTSLSLVDNADFILDESFVIIENDGTDPVIGTFNGLPNGAAISGNGRTWNIFYNYNGSNDVVLVTEKTDLNVYVDATGDVIFMDPYMVDDNLTMVIDGANYRISDPGRALVVGPGVIKDGNDALIPIASVTGEIHIDTEEGNDNFNIDVTGGNFTDAINYDGGDDNDGLTLTGNSSYDQISHFFYTTTNTISITGNSSISYTGLELSVLDRLTARTRIFNENRGDDLILNSTPSTLEYQIGTTTQGWVDFDFPNDVLALEIDNSLNINYFGSGLDASFVIGTPIAPANTIDLNATINLGSGDLELTSQQLNIYQPITTTGSISTRTSGRTLIENSVVQTTSGFIDMATTGNNLPEMGLRLTGTSEIRTTTGNIDLAGNATGNAFGIFANAKGVSLENTSGVYSQTGNITINGTGGTSSADVSVKGFYMSNETTIENLGGDIKITGISTSSRTEDEGYHIGVLLKDRATIQNTNDGKITITGQGGFSYIGSNHGVDAEANTLITAEDGTITIKGKAIDYGDNIDDGMRVGGTISTTGTGDIILEGEGSTHQGNSGASINVRPSGQITAGGTIGISGIGRPIYTGAGIPLQSQFDGTSTTVNGVLAPGKSSSAQINVNGNLVMASDDTLELGVNGFATAGTDYDQIKVNGAVDITGVTLALTDNSGVPSVDPEILVLIDNDGTDAITGKFNGLPNGASVPGNGKTWYIYYSLGDGNDVILSSSPINYNVIVDASGNLLFLDPFAVADNLTLTVDGPNYRISDSGKSVAAGPGATQDGNDVLVPIVAVTGAIHINTGDGSDTLNIDFDNGNFANEISFNGGNEDDGLSLSGTAIHNNVVHTINNSGEGRVRITDNEFINYTALNQTITDRLNVNERTFTINVSNHIVLEPTGTLENQIRISDIITIDYDNPNNVLTINGEGPEEGFIQINGFATGFDAHLVVIKEEDQVRFGASRDTNLGGGTLLVTSKVALFRANITTRGQISITAFEAIHIEGAIIQSTAGEDIIMRSGISPLPGTGFDGIQMFNSTIQTYGAGNIDLNGKAFLESTISNVEGITLFETNLITDTGDINISGSGPTNGAYRSKGVNMSFSTVIQSNGGNINIIGTAGNSISELNVGVTIFEGALIETIGAGTITVQGTGGIGTDKNYGVEIQNNATIKTQNGTISITGSSLDTTGSDQIGTTVEGIVNATGSGNISVTGTSGTVNDPAINLLSSSAQLQTGGNLDITANLGVINTPSGVTGQTEFTATNITINGVLAPGQSPGQLTVDGDLTMQSDATLEIEVNNFTIAGTDYDQLVVNGIVDLNGATLNLLDNSGSFSNAENLILISNDSDDAILGTFNGLSNGSPIPGNGKTWYIYYNQGDGNDVVLSSELLIPNVVVDPSGNMVFTDPYKVNDALTIIVEGVNYRISDSGKPVLAGTGTTQDGNDVLVPVTSVTGDININTGDGMDSLNVDLSGGGFTDAINLNGGNEEDGLSLSGTGTYTNNIHEVNGQGEGTIAITGNGLISYTGLEQTITDRLNVNERFFTLNVDNTATLEPIGGLENQILISNIVTIDYNNPSNGLTINGSGSDEGIIRVNGFASGFDAHLVIIKEEDVVHFGPNKTINLGSGRLLVTSKSVVFEADISTQGAITVTSYEGTSISESNIISSAGEDITINAGVIPGSGSSFNGIEMNRATLSTSGAGNITLDGKAFSVDPLISGTGGIIMTASSILTDMGTITISGKGPSSGDNQCKGVIVGLDTVIQSNGGNINITGIGGECLRGVNVGVSLVINMIIKTIGSGNITIDGDSGLTSDYNVGVESLGTSSSITTENGMVSITGNSLATSGTGHIGVRLEGAVNTTGTGDVTINGTVNSPDNISINLPELDTQIQAGNDLRLYGISGPIRTPEGPARHALFTANNIFINGVLKPGRSVRQLPGQLIVNGNLEADVASTLDIEVNDFAMAGIDYDQIVVNGTVDISGATLNVTDNSGSFSGTENLILINNDGNDPILGTFDGLPNGAAIAGNAKTWYIYYNLGGENDVLLSSSAPNVYIDGSGNLVFSDPRMLDDNLTISIEDTNYRISDATKPVIAGPGATQDGDDVLVVIASVTGEINIDTGGGNDYLNVDLNSGDFTDEIIFDGGNQSDGIILLGTNIYDNVTHTLTGDNEDEGSVAISGNSTITYRAIEQTIIDNLDANDRVFELDLDDAIVFDSLGSLDNQLDIFRGIVIDYKNPSNLLTINSIGEGQNTLMIRGVGDGFDADITVNASERDDVRFDSNKVIDIGNGEFNLNSGTLLFGSNSTVRTTGSIMVNTKSVTSILGNVHSNGGNISVTGGTELTSKDNYSGIFLYDCHIETTGAGAITLDGTAYFNTASDIVLDGILMRRNSRIVTDNGDITLMGKGIDNGLVNYTGVHLEESSRIESNRGHITITGTARDHEDDANIGVWLDESTRIETGKAVILDITGEGQTGIKLGGLISTGNVNLVGTSRSADSPAINIETSIAKVQGFEDVTLTANTGSINTPAGVANQSQLEARIGKITISGVLAPGQSSGSEIGQLIAEGDVILQSDATLEIDMNNFDRAGVDYDQLMTHGSFVDINDATLVLNDNTSMLLPGQSVTLVLIDNDRPLDKVSGTFKGLPNGAAIAGNDKTWYIYYNNGDGNDVILSSEKIEARLHPRVYLQGAGINPNTDAVTLMRDDLRIAEYIPTTSPYEDEVIAEASVFAVTGTNAIVDWVWVELRDKDDNSKVLYNQSALLQRDGDVVAVDGVSDLSFIGVNSDDFYVAINHRNHLGVISAMRHTLNNVTTVVDFTTNTESAQGGNNALVELENDTYGLYAGDFNTNAAVEDTDANGLIPSLGAAGYRNGDMDANGQVQNTDLHNLVLANLGQDQQFAKKAGTGKWSKASKEPNIKFAFANAEITNDGNNNFYEADIMIESTEDFKLGSGQLYINYNTAAFGENISTNGKIEYTQPAGSILGEVSGSSVYKDFIQNDNTNSRISLSFQQGVGSGTITKNNVTTEAKVLFHIKIQYLNVDQDPQICFESDTVFSNQFFTACGGDTCTNTLGTQLLNDTFDCVGAVLEIEEITDLGVRMYPNPTTGIFYIKGLAEKSTIDIYDSYGRLVFRKEDYLEEAIDISHLETAMYLVNIVNRKEKHTKRLIKK